METISLSKTNGDKALVVAKVVIGDFAVHRNILSDLYPNSWKVTHIPSGAGMAQAETMHLARVVAHVFASLPGEWPDQTIATTRSQNKRRLAMLRLTKAWPPEVLRWALTVQRQLLYEEAA